MTKYARDEFDKVPDAASRQGVRRAASAPVRHRLWPILSVGIAALAIGLVSFLILPKLGLPRPEHVTAWGRPPRGRHSSFGQPELRQVRILPRIRSLRRARKPGLSVRLAVRHRIPGAVLNKAQGVAVYNAAGTAGLAGRVS